MEQRNKKMHITRTFKVLKFYDQNVIILYSQFYSRNPHVFKKFENVKEHVFLCMFSRIKLINVWAGVLDF